MGGLLSRIGGAAPATDGEGGAAQGATPPIAAPHEASVAQTVLNMVCNIMGGAVLALPTAMMNASILWGVLLLFGTSIASLTSIAMLACCSHKLQRYTYKEILAIGVSEKVGKGFEFILFLYTYGVLVEYARIIADSMPDAVEHLFHAHGVATESWLWLIIAFFLFFGLSSLKALSELTWSSVLGFVTIAYVVVMVVVRYLGGYERHADESGLNAPDVDAVAFKSSILRSVPVITMSFSCHYNVPAYYRELKDRSLRRMGTAAAITLGTILSLYTINGVMGYTMFGNARLRKVHGNVVNGFAASDLAINIGRLGLFFHFVCVYPIVAIGCRRCLNTIVFGKADQSQRTYIIEAFLLVSTSCTLAYFVNGIAIVIEIIGSLFGTYIVFVLPGLMYLRVFRDSFEEAYESRAAAAAEEAAAAAATTVAVNYLSSDDASSMGLLSSSARSSPTSAQINHDNFKHMAGSSYDAIGGAKREAAVTGTTSEFPPLQPVARVRGLYWLAYFFMGFGFVVSIASFGLTMDNLVNGD